MLSVTGSLASTIGQYNPFRYRSYYYDTETGFYYLQSRYYDPTVGRFLNADGIVGANGGIQGYNLFAYCNNNPIIYIDISGMSLLDIEGADFDFDGINTFSFEDDFFTSYGTITIEVDIRLKNIPDMSFTIEDFTVLITKNSITITEINGHEIVFDYDFVNDTMAAGSVSGDINEKASWKISEDGVGGSVSFDTEIYEITVTTSIKPNLVSILAKMLEAVKVPAGAGGGKGSNIANSARVMYGCGGCRFNLLGVMDYRFI